MPACPDMSYDTVTFEHEIVRLDEETEEIDEVFTAEVKWEVEYEAPGRNSRFRFDADRYSVQGVSFISSNAFLSDSEIEELEYDVPGLFKAYLESQSPY